MERFDGYRGGVRKYGKVRQLTGNVNRRDAKGNREVCQLAKRCDGLGFFGGFFWVFLFRSLRKYDTLSKTHTSPILSAILSFSKLLPENPRIHAFSRNSKNIQGFVNSLDILESS